MFMLHRNVMKPFLLSIPLEGTFSKSVLEIERKKFLTCYLLNSCKFYSIPAKGLIKIPRDSLIKIPRDGSSDSCERGMIEFPGCFCSFDCRRPISSMDS